MSTNDFNSDLQKKTQTSYLQPVATPGAKEDDKISLLELLIVLAERKRLILTVVSIFAAVGILVSFLLPKRFTATLTLMPPQQSSSSLSSMLSSQLGGLGGMASLATGLKNPNETYVALLKSRTVEDAMVQRFGLMQEYKVHYISDARKVFEKNTIVDGSSKDGLIHISVEDNDPNRAAELANAYVEEYRKLSKHLAITEAGQRRLFFEQQLEQARNNLADAEEALKNTEQTTGFIQLDSQAKALIQSAVTLRAQITAKEVQIQGMGTYATGENAQLVQAEQELNSLRAQLAKLGGNADNQSEGFIVPKGQIPQAGLEYARKFRDVKYNETIFEILARQFEAAKLDEAKQGAVIQVVDPAIPPDKKSSPPKALIILLATIAGALLSILVALLQSVLLHMKEDPENAQMLHVLKSMLDMQKSSPGKI